ncbi:tRNA methyltransferase 10 homolog A-like [Amphibalanus amphitrite]|uniref:tRNA methyltransferase 10 homolog A-like n=1 Tax=Amphibalanus amphitrite TaxID=1232801 RepID=UPI001C905CA4|nr:tRNA methyltransferase 10 homolog A-like [Amphibalanus amphitrite]XP_043243914.1 tRNA methyltransferase 10 homolog A-like [Amphibalanus amphitrite]
MMAETSATSLLTSGDADMSPAAAAGQPESVTSDTSEVNVSSSKTHMTSTDRKTEKSDNATDSSTNGQSKTSDAINIATADSQSEPSDATHTPSEGEATLSKRQRKRLAKREAFLAQRPALRRAERQRRKEKRAAAVAAAIAAGDAPPKRPRLAPMASGSGVQVVIDLSFDDLMTERDLGKCLKQVQRCYAANRRAARPVQFLLTSMDGESRRLMDANDGWQNWDVRIERDHLLDVLPHEKVTYLTSDSEHQLDKLEPGRAYVIGGLVDHNHHKGECLRRAREAGIAHARLPIDDFVEMKTRKVLTIDHVFSILLLVAGGSGWRQALQQVLPARKGAIIKGETSDGDCSTETTESVGDGGPAHASRGDSEAAATAHDGTGKAEEDAGTGVTSGLVAESQKKVDAPGAEPSATGTPQAVNPESVNPEPVSSSDISVCGGKSDASTGAGDGAKSVEEYVTNGSVES